MAVAPFHAVNGVMRVWDVSSTLAAVTGKQDAPDIATTAKDIQYANAKVLLVGESGVGKSGLANFLAKGIRVDENKPLTSTDGAWATQWTIPHNHSQTDVAHEIWLWDFAGQVDYRLVHQLFMDDTSAAVLVFNPQNENPFDGLGQWDRDLQKSTRKPFAKLLAAGRTDRGGLVVSNDNVTEFMQRGGFRQPLHLTSALTGAGCAGLRDEIVAAIDWSRIPITTSLTLYHRIKAEILKLRDSGTILIRLSELNQRLELLLRDQPFTTAELRTAIGHLAGPGMIQRLDFGGFLLLRPEVLSRYAAALVRKVRRHPQELGCLSEAELLAGDLDYQEFTRLPNEDEEVVLRALLETVVNQAWCLRQPSDQGNVLTFPSYFRRERKEPPTHPHVLVSYRFAGPVDDLYATLVVRLHHTDAFDSTDLWKDAADFQTQTGQKLGLHLIREGEGTCRLDAYFAPDVDENSRVLFLGYVDKHLRDHAQEVERLRHYFCRIKKCNRFNQPYADRAAIDTALRPGANGKVFCPACGKPILLRDALETRFESREVKEQVRLMQEEGQTEIDNESRELILVGHAFCIVAEAGQIYRGYTNSDHGIDGEIEFKDDAGHASGKRLYLQLKSGDSYLTKRKRDGAEVFQIKKETWATYWQSQAYPVMLVIRTSNGEIRWMDVSAYLKEASHNGPDSVTQIVFEGERFDAASVHRWRRKFLEECSA